MNVVKSLSIQLSQTAERIASLSEQIELCGSSDENGCAEFFDQIVLTELENAQSLVLELTKNITGLEEVETNTDESAFAEGELNYTKKGDIENPITEENENE